MDRGRTDAGVHALGRVASVWRLSKLYDTKELKDSLNRYLPEDIRINEIRTYLRMVFMHTKGAQGKTPGIILTVVKTGCFSRRYCYHYPKTGHRGNA